jgi:nicotinamidase/pyrazinamidase
MQNDFMPGGSLAVAEADQIIDILNAMNRRVRALGGISLFTGDQHPLITPHFGPNAWPVHCVAGTYGAQLTDRLEVLPGDILLDKGMEQTDGYSATEGVTRDGRTLEQVIRPIGNERVDIVMGGVATEFCVLNTALGVLELPSDKEQVRLFVLRDAIRAVNLQAGDGDKGIAQMKAAGAIIIDSVEVLTGKAFELAH